MFGTRLGLLGGANRPTTIAPPGEGRTKSNIMFQCIAENSDLSTGMTAVY